MPVRDTAVDQGARRSRFLRTRLAAELETARLAAGMSYRELARQLGVGREVIRRVAELRRRFPVETRSCLQALRRGIQVGTPS